MKKKITIEFTLFKKACQEDLTAEEREVFNLWLESDPGNQLFFEKATLFYASKKDIDFFEENDPDLAYEKFYGHISRKRINIRSYLSWAAGLLVLVTLSLFFLMNPEKKKTGESLASDIIPGKSKATLTLSNGEKLQILDMDSTRELTDQQGIILIDSARIAYSGKEDETGTLAMNTLEIPRGGEFHLILSDGTEVWLNSETRLEYPVRFSGPTREITLSGEAFFKVAENKSRPFMVHTGESMIKVTGTAFNVSAYSGDENQIITLAEGGVEINQLTGIPFKQFRLTPDQQFIFNRHTRETQIKKVDASIYSAWTKGNFAFEEESLEQVFTKLGRWYAIDFRFENNQIKEETISGTLPRFEDFSVILGLLENVTDAEFTADGNQITIK